MYVCMYVCMYVRMYVCMYVRMYVCMYVCTYVDVCMYVHMYVCMYVCICYLTGNQIFDIGLHEMGINEVIECGSGLLGVISNIPRHNSSCCSILGRATITYKYM